MPTPAELAEVKPKQARESSSAPAAAAWLADPSAPPRKNSTQLLIEQWEQEARSKGEIA